MDIKEFKTILNRYERLAALYRTIERKVNEIRNESISAVAYGGNCHGSSVSNSPEAHAIRLNCYLRKLKEISLNMTAIEARVIDVIQVLTYEEQLLITERFLKGVSMSVLCKKYFYTYESLRVKYCRIFKKLEKVDK